MIKNDRLNLVKLHVLIIIKMSTFNIQLLPPNKNCTYARKRWFKCLVLGDW